MKTTSLLVSSFALATLALSFTACPAEAKVWDARTDFSVANGNPNGDWTYGWMDTGFQTFTPFTLHSQGTWPGWYGWADSTPHVAVNDTGSVANAVLPGQLSLHPGNGNQPAIIRWTAPAGVTGEATIVGQFLPGDGASMAIAVRKDNSSILWSGSNSGSFSLSTEVTPGTTIDFAVYGGYAYGNTPLEAVITAVPEPGIALLAISTASLLVLRRRPA